MPSLLKRVVPGNVSSTDSILVISDQNHTDFAVLTGARSVSIEESAGPHHGYHQHS